MSVDGLWRQTSADLAQPTGRRLDDYTDEGAQSALADLQRRVADKAAAMQSAQKPAGWLSGPWKRIFWLAAGTVAWVPFNLYLRDALGGQSTLLEYVLLALIWGTVIGLTRESDS